MPLPRRVQFSVHRWNADPYINNNIGLLASWLARPPYEDTVTSFHPRYMSRLSSVNYAWNFRSIADPAAWWVFGLKTGVPSILEGTMDDFKVGSLDEELCSPQITRISLVCIIINTTINRTSRAVWFARESTSPAV